MPVTGSTIAVYVALALCAVVIGLAARRYDLYLREPWYAVLACIGLGALAMHLAGEAQRGMIQSVHQRGVLVTDPMLAIMAGTTEELAKFTVVVVIWAGFRRWFEEANDGLIYGSFAGLGAAIEESIAIFLRDTPVVLPAQEPVRLAGHLVMGGIAGYGVGLMIRGPAGPPVPPRTAARWLFWCLVVAVVLHIAWDVVAFAAAKSFVATRATSAWQTAGGIVLMFAGMVMYRWLVARSAALTRAMLGVCDARTKQCPVTPESGMTTARGA